MGRPRIHPKPKPKPPSFGDAYHSDWRTLIHLYGEAGLREMLGIGLSQLRKTMSGEAPGLRVWSSMVQVFELAGMAVPPERMSLEAQQLRERWRRTVVHRRSEQARLKNNDNPSAKCSLETLSGFVGGNAQLAYMLGVHISLLQQALNNDSLNPLTSALMKLEPLAEKYKVTLPKGSAHAPARQTLPAVEG